MDWTAPVDAYCERLGPEYWAEPVNAVTNLAFVLAALWLWPRTAGRGIDRALAAILAAIGVGSWLFHTHATGWAGLADVLPILLFVLVYFYAANRDFHGMRPAFAALGALAFVPYAALVGPVFAALPFFEISSFYWPIPLLIFGYALTLWRRAPATARGLAIGGAILCASLTFRSLDMVLCDVVPLGTHFMWHILNGLMLGWMIHVHLRHVP